MDILQRRLLPDVHKEVRYGNDHKWEFDQNTIAKIKTKGGNLGLVGILSYSGGDIKIISRLVEIETSVSIASAEKKVGYGEFRKKSEKLAEEIAQEIVADLMGQAALPNDGVLTSGKKGNKTWLWIGGGALVVGGIATAILLSEKKEESSIRSVGPPEFP